MIARPHWRLLSLASLVASCAVPVVTERPDVTRADRVAVDAAPRDGAQGDVGSLDANSGMDAIAPIDGALRADSAMVSMDVAAPPPCDSRFAFNPSPVGDDAPFEVRFTDPTGWAFIGLDWTGPARPSWAFVDVVARDPFTWLFRVQPTTAGRYTVAFTADNGARRLGSCTFDVQPFGGARDSGVVPPMDSAVPAGTFVTRSATNFTAGGARFRFIGMNSAGLPHFGATPLMFARVDQIAVELDEMRRMGVRVVRVFAAAEDADNNTVIARLGRVLDLAAARGIYVIAALTDFYATTPYHPQGDRAYYARDPRFPLDLLSPDFFRSGYRTNYLPWVRAVVSRYAAHPAVFAWELGNEIKCDDDHRAFINFENDVSTTIRMLDARHMITTGMITARWATDAEALEIYRLPNIDFITYHNYNGTLEFADFDYGIARMAGKPFIVEEAGFESGDRPTRVDADIRAHMDTRGSSGYMQWGFTVITPDNGNGDRQFGMDRLFHASDYDRLFSTYSAAAARYR